MFEWGRGLSHGGWWWLRFKRHPSINVLLLIGPSLARLSKSRSLFRVPESYVSAWRCYHPALVGNVIQLIHQPPQNDPSPCFTGMRSTVSNLSSAIHFSNTTFRLSLARFGQWLLESYTSTTNGSPGITLGNFRWAYVVMYTAHIITYFTVERTPQWGHFVRYCSVI